MDHRRRQHDQRLQGRPGQGDQQRVRPGGRGQDRRLPGRVRPGARRRHQRHHEVGRQRVPRRRLRLLRLDGHRGRAAVPAGRLGHRRDARRRRPADRLRRRSRRVPPQGPALVLRRLQPRQPPERRSRGSSRPTYVSTSDPISARLDGQSLLRKADLERRDHDDARRHRLRRPVDDLGRRRSRSAPGPGRRST